MTPSELARALEDNSHRAEQRLREAEQALYAGSEHEAQLEHQIASKLGDIASLQLHDTAALDARTRQQLEQREQAQTALVQALKQAEQVIGNTLPKHDALRQDIAQLEKQVQEQLEQNPEARLLLTQLEAAQQAEQGGHSSYEEIRDECETKLQGYAGSRLYSYLKARDYGTDRYRPKPLQRPLDNYLARCVDFQRNQANEQILLTMQARNESARQARSAIREQLQAQYQPHLEQACEKLGMPKLQTEEQALSTLLSESKARATSLQAQLIEFAEQRDPYLTGIRQTITERLKARPMAELIAAAAQTPDPRDDVLVSELQLLHGRLNAFRQGQKSLQDRVADRRHYYERAKAIEHGLRDQDFLDDECEYTLDQPIKHILGEYMRGALDQEAVEEILNEGRDYETPYSRKSFYISNSYSSGGFAGRSSSSSSSGFSTSRSSGGGGFRTTDSF